MSFIHFLAEYANIIVGLCLVAAVLSWALPVPKDVGPTDEVCPGCPECRPDRYESLCKEMGGCGPWCH